MYPYAPPEDQQTEGKPEKLEVDLETIPNDCEWHGEFSFIMAATREHEEQGILQFLMLLEQFS